MWEKGRSDFLIMKYLLKSLQKNKTMKKAILVTAVICAIQITGFCQNDQVAISTNSVKQSTKTFHDFSYYFTGMLNNSYVFSKDTLKLAKVEMDEAFPKFVFSGNGKFYFYYGFSQEKRKVRNLSTGDLEERFAKTPKIISGGWKSDDGQKNIRLIFSDQSVVDYSIIEEDKFIYFIKQK